MYFFPPSFWELVWLSSQALKVHHWCYLVRSRYLKILIDSGSTRIVSKNPSAKSWSAMVLGLICRLYHFHRLKAALDNSVY